MTPQPDRCPPPARASNCDTCTLATVTLKPRASSSFWACSCFQPATSGTVTFSGPALMTTLMMVPSGLLAWLGGFWLRMVPLGLSL